jgi:hypothetical protein
MLSGTADVEGLARHLGAPTISQWGSDAFELRDVGTLQLVAEMRRGGRDMLLPPGLHPTDPLTLSIQAWRVGDSEVGPFSFCHTRVSCRSGVRARGLTTAAYADAPAAVDLLRDRYGYPCQLGEIGLRTHYDGTDLLVAAGGRTILAVSALDPDPLGPDDVQYTATLNLADTPNGMRLVQVEAHHHADVVERVAGRIVTFDGAAWGNERFDPYFVVTTTVARDNTVSVPAVRFVCRADVSAFEGTEAVTR